MVSICSADGQRAMKLDVCIARLYDDDQAALVATASVRAIFRPTARPLFTSSAAVWQRSARAASISTWAWSCLPTAARA